jgi:hypothetical protein
MRGAAVGTIWRQALRRVERRALQARAAYMAGGNDAYSIRKRERAEQLLHEAVRLANNLAH